MKNKKLLIISSIIILLPMLVGIILWDKLPSMMNVHWGVHGEADGMGSRAFAVFAIPLIFLAFHWICIAATNLDKSAKTQSPKVMGMLYWIMPVISLFSNGIVYMSAFGKSFGLESAIFVLIGLTLVAVGNYLPKCKQNYTVGIKIKWTLISEENWNATHRFSGKVWVVCGIAVMCLGFLPASLAACAIAPIFLIVILSSFLYSYLYYRKQLKSGVTFEKCAQPYGKYKIVSVIAVAVIIVAVLVLMFTGDVKVEYGDSSFTLKASYWQDLTVEYADIDSIEYRDDISVGLRTNGFGSGRLALGSFKNDELGRYTRYAYTGVKECVLLTSNGKSLVISGKDQESTRAIYEKLNSLMHGE